MKAWAVICLVSAASCINHVFATVYTSKRVNTISYVMDEGWPFHKTTRHHYQHMDNDHWLPQRDTPSGLHRRNLLIDETDSQWLPIRIGVNTDVLEADDASRTCYNVGARFKRGNPASNLAMCNHDQGVSTNCWDICTSSYVLSHSSKQFAIQTIVPMTIAAIQDVLLVERVVGSLQLNGEHCADGVRVTNTPIAGTDVYIYVSSRPVDVGSKSLAAGRACETDQFDRPISGNVNFGPDDTWMQVGVPSKYDLWLEVPWY